MEDLEDYQKGQRSGIYQEYKVEADQDTKNILNKSDFLIILYYVQCQNCDFLKLAFFPHKTECMYWNTASINSFGRIICESKYENSPDCAHM